jgi:hypothetical protein
MTKGEEGGARRKGVCLLKNPYTLWNSLKSDTYRKSEFKSQGERRICDHIPLLRLAPPLSACLADHRTESVHTDINIPLESFPLHALPCALAQDCRPSQSRLLSVVKVKNPWIIAINFGLMV